jgi:hypothetical protein
MKITDGSFGSGRVLLTVPNPGAGDRLDLTRSPAAAGATVEACARPDDRPAGGTAVLDDLEIDDSESPAIGVAPVGTTWDEVRDHVKIAHSPLLVWPPDAAEYAGAYWAGTEVVIADDLGPDQDEAVSEFRDLLRERGEA